MDKFGLSIILPVINEEKNLEVLIPSLAQISIKHFNNFYEIVIVDDGSIDNTSSLILSLSKKYNLVHLKRNKPRSLPHSIYEGIEISGYSNIMWLDADGSMDSKSANKLITSFLKDDKKVYIGSRFVEGGGYKGKEFNKRNMKSLKDIFNSEDSIIAIYLSLVFNKILKILLKIDVSDLTSGFIIGKKNLFSVNMFENFIYGEYFISVLANLHNKKVQIEEVGYLCLVRNFGESKSSTNIFRMIKLSKPYIITAIKVKKQLNGNSR